MTSVEIFFSVTAMPKKNAGAFFHEIKLLIIYYRRF